MTNRLAVVAILVSIGTSPVAAQAPGGEPDSATVAAGKKIFEGAGLCFSCHGMNGEGMLGPTTMLNAAKAKWLHSDGSWTGIVKLVTTGVDGGSTESGQIMPPRGGSAISDEQVRQVAAYVLALHRKKLK